jgi:transposase
MQVLYQRCAGLDVHKRVVVACVLITLPDGTVHDHVKTFGAMTADLVRLSQWLREQQVEQIALESTGVYWWPVFNLLEADGHQVLLVNPQHVKAVPGRKTDVADSKWLADLLRHGLLKASFVPPALIRQLRELMRYRKTLVHDRTQEANRLQKVLESANVKLASVASDVLGVSGRRMLNAMVTGEDDPMRLADLAKGQLRRKMALLQQALHGRIQPHHRTLIAAILRHVSFLEESIAALDAQVERMVGAFARQLALLQTIPGVNRIAALTILAEIGPDMHQFASAKHLASWAGVCPGNKQSGGKRLSGQTTQGSPWLRAVLGEVAWAAIRQKNTSFGARFRRLAHRHNKQKAVVAVMHNLVLVIYHVLQDQAPYREAGADYYVSCDPQRRVRTHVRQLERLGFAVTLVPNEVA